MIGKIIFGKIGLTEFLGDTKKTLNFDTHVDAFKLEKLKYKIKTLDKDEIRIRTAVNDSSLNIDGLADYAVDRAKQGKDINIESVEELLKSQIANQAHGFLGVNTAIKKYNELTDVTTKNKFAKTISQSNSNLGKYLTGLKGANAGMGRYAASLVTATAKTFALKTATMAMNATISMGVSFAISGIITAITNYANRVDNAIDASHTAKETIDEANNSFKTQQDLIKESGRKYAELAQHVNQLNNTNLDLKEDDYENFLNLSNQIAEQFPGLIKGYDDNGNAILNLQGTINDINSTLDDYIIKAKEASQIKIVQAFKGAGDNEDYFKGAKYEVDELNGKADKAKKELENLQKTKNTISTSSPKDDTTDLFGNYSPGTDSRFKADYIRKYLEDSELDRRKLNDISTSLVFSKILPTDEYMRLYDAINERDYDLDGKLSDSAIMTINEILSKYSDESGYNISDYITQQIKSASDDYNQFADDVKTKNKEISQNAQAVLEQSVIWSNPDTTDKMKDTMTNALAQIDWSDKQFEGFDGEQAAHYIQTTFASSFEKLSADDKISVDKFFELDPNRTDITEYIDLYEKIKEIFKKQGIQIPIKTDEIENVQNNFEESLNKMSDKDKEVVKKYLEDNSIDSASELEVWNKRTEGITNATDAISAYEKKAQEASQNISKDTTLSFSEAWEAIGTSGDEEADKKALEAKEALLELAEAGKLTVEAFNNSSIAENFLKDTKLSAWEATQEINGLVSSADQLASMKTGISSISSILGEKKENQSSKKTRTKGIGPDTLAGMPEDIKAQTKEYEHFVEILGDGTKEMKDCKDAANKLATAYVNSGNFLANLTKENEDYYISVLDEMGVENAAEVVTAALKKQKVNAEMATVDLNNATKQEISDLGEYIEKLDNSSRSLAYYTLQQQIANNNALDTSDSAKKLMKLAKQCGITGEAILILKSLISDMQLLESGQITTPRLNVDAQHAGEAKQHLEDEINSAKKRLNKLINKGAKVGTPKVTSKNPSNPKDNTKDDNPTSDKAKSTQQIDWISRALDRLSSKLDLVKAKYDNLFTNKKAKNSDSLLNLRNKNLDKQYKLLQKTEKYQEKAQKKYTGKANSVRISKNKEENASLKKAVREGRIKGDMEQLIATYGEKKAEKIQKYQDWYDKAQEQKKNWIGTKTAMRENRIQKYQNIVDNTEEKRSLVQAQKENAATAKAKNDLIHKESKHLETSYDYQIRIARLEKDSLKVAQLQAQKKKELRDLTIEQHQNLADEYQSILDQYNAEKELATKASEKNNLIESEKAKTQELYTEKIAIAKQEGSISEQKQLQAELDKQLRDLQIEQHQNSADEYQTTLDRLSAEKELAVKAGDKNSLIEQEKAVTNQIYAEKIQIAELEKNHEEITRLQNELRKEQLNLEIEQHQNIADEHQSNLDMLSAQKENIKTASDKNDVVDKEKNLTVQLYNEKIAIANLEEKTSEQLKLQAELAKQLVQLEKEKFDNLCAYYANLRKINENQAKNLGHSLDELEARGLIATRSLYAEQKKLNDEKKKNYEEELILLEGQHDNIEKDTQEWYDSLDSIHECKDQIAGCVKTAIELGDAVRNINWQIFEKMSSRLDLLSSEYELAIKLMSNKKLTDDGSFTKEGTATLGAYYSELILAQKKTEESWKTLADMKRHIDQGDDGYTDQKALDEYDEKRKNHIDLVEAEYDIQQNLIDLMKQKYQEELDFLQDIISKRKELLQAEKDAYDYQKTINEKTKNIGVLSKQVSALNGDESEDAKARVQKLWVSLDEANKDLQDTEYSQWIADQQKMLDNLYNEYSDFMDDKLNDTDALLSEAITYLGNIDVGTSVSQSLEEYYEKYGYDPTDDFNDVKTELGESGSIAKAVGNAADRIIQSSENRHQNQAKADDVSKSISEIGNVYEDPEAIERYRETQKAYDGLATGGVGGENIQKYVSESAKSELDAKGKEVDDVLKLVSEFEQYVASIGSMDDRSSYTETNRQLLAHAYELYENLPASAKELVGNHKHILDHKQFQYDYHGNTIREEQRIAEERAAAEQETASKTARDHLINIIRDTYLKDGRTYALMDDEGVINGELDTMLKTHGLFRNDGYSLSETGAAAIMNQLGYSRPEQQTREYMVRYMKQIGFSDGGIAQTLQKVPSINGDDGWVTLKKGEGILTPEQTPEFLKLVHNLDTLNPAVDLVRSLPQKAFAAAPNHTFSQSTGDIHIDMNFPNVTNYEEFRRQMQSDPKIEKMFKSMIWDKGDLSKYKITM